jgi:hypothetical protein
MLFEFGCNTILGLVAGDYYYDMVRACLNKAKGDVSLACQVLSQDYGIESIGRICPREPSVNLVGKLGPNNIRVWRDGRNIMESPDMEITLEEIVRYVASEGRFIPAKWRQQILF